MHLKHMKHVGEEDIIAPRKQISVLRARQLHFEHFMVPRGLGRELWILRKTVQHNQFFGYGSM